MPGQGPVNNTARRTRAPELWQQGTDGGLCAWTRASLVYTVSPRYTNCSNCASMSVGGSRTGPPRAAMTAR